MKNYLFGVGLRYYFDSEDVLIPFFADFRSNYFDNKISPYLSLAIGYSCNAKDKNFRGVGFLINPTVGISIKVSDKSAVNMGLGYEMQRVNNRVYYDSGWGISNYDASYNCGAVSLVVGISF